MSRLIEEVKRLSRKLDDIDRRVEKIEESIGESKEVQNLRERVEHMWLSYVPEITPEAPVPEFKVGDKFIPHKPKNYNGYQGLYWHSFMDKFDGKTLSVDIITTNGRIRVRDGNYVWTFLPSWCTKVEELYFPKKGEYFYAQFKGPYFGFVSIYSDIREHYGEQKIFDKATLFLCTNDCYTGDSPLGAVTDIINIRPATAEEEALLDSKLAEKGLRFDKEKCELVGIPKYKKPAMGKMAIFWDNDRKLSVCRFFYMINDKGMFLDNSNIPWKNAILFESPEQYKNFLKEK